MKVSPEVWRFHWRCRDFSGGSFEVVVVSLEVWRFSAESGNVKLCAEIHLRVEMRKGGGVTLECSGDSSWR